MINMLRSFPARCWLASLVLLLCSMATAYFYPFSILAKFAHLAALPFMICTIIFFGYLVFKATGNTVGRISLIAAILTISFWQSSWIILGAGLIYLIFCLVIRIIGNQVKNTGREMSLEEKWYWCKLHSYFDGFYPRYPKKPNVSLHRNEQPPT